MFKSLDIEDALRQDLQAISSDGFFYACLPIPDDLGKHLPMVIIERFGGSRTSHVIDDHTVGLDIYAKHLDDAMRAANCLCNSIELLRDTDGLTADYLDSEVSTIPYTNPDPERPDLSRVSFSISVSTRTE